MVYVPAMARISGHFYAPPRNPEPCIRRGITRLPPSESRRLLLGLQHVIDAGSTRAIGELIVRAVDEGLSIFEVLTELDALQLLPAEILQHLGGCDWPIAPMHKVPT